MKKAKYSIHRSAFYRLVPLFLCLLFSLPTVTALAHGGKTHAAGEISALKVVQKALAFYDKLIVSGKLDESWETGLQQIQVQKGQTQNQPAFSVSFTRARQGLPANAQATVYIFFSGDGTYTGSNFTGPPK